MTSNERRQRYVEAFRSIPVKYSQDYIEPLSGFEAEIFADAAIAVADEEISKAVGDRAALVLENARLHTELEESNE